MVKSEFIETEMGIIPSCWTTIRLIEIAENKKELFDDGDWVESEHITNQGIRLIQTGNIGLGKFLEKGIKKYISSKSFETLRCKELQIGDLLICRLAEPAGRSCIFEGTEDEKVITSVDVTIFRPNNTRYDRKYLNQYFTTNFWLSAVSENSGGTTHKRISRGTLGKLYVPLPPLPEQTAIATALSDMDALIAQTGKLIEKKKAIKQGVMQELLRPKEGWVTKKIPEVCWFQEGPGVRKHQFTQNGVKLLNGTNIQFGKLELENTDKFISENEAFGWYSHFLVDAQDILIACSGVSIDKFHDKVTVADKHHLPLCMNTSTMRFKVDSKQLDKSYFIQFLKSKNFKEQISGKATGSAQLNFGPSHVKMIEISLPNIEKQIEIGNILDDFENQIIKCETKLQKLKLQKQGMMQALLTGKIRLV